MGPGANFQSKAAVMRKHAATMRNTPFAATEELMVCDFSNSYSYLRCSQASSDYDPSFVTEILLKEIKYSETPNQDINLLHSRCI